MFDDPFPIVEQVAAALDRVGVEYALGGSAASSLFGEPRTTNGVDIAVFSSEAQVELTLRPLEPSFFIDFESARAAVRRRASFNIFQRDTMLKFDFFVLSGEAFDREQMRRRRYVAVVEGSSQRVAVTSPEDLVLRKLAWFRVGGEVSERQWRDVVGILKLQRGALDLVHSRRWAGELHVGDLLERALVESGLV